MCDKFGPVCPQLPFGPIEIDDASEDCLSLNVFTPIAKPSGEEKLAVYVWIYGGRFIAGSGSQPPFEGTGLAKKGIVVVTLNYRVGILGFLATPELDEESGVGSSGNYGVLDQRAALEWVRDNITNFGGDPSKVTIGGQSAGGASTGLHVLSPLSKGLFRGAIPQAGKRFTHDPLLSGLAPSYRSKEKAIRQGLETLKEKGASTIAELRKMPIDDLLVGNNKNDDQWGNPPFYRPCIDGYVLPYDYSGCLEHGTQNDVPIMTGHNADEGGTYADPEFTLEDFKSCAKQKYGELAERFFELYPATKDEEVLDAWNAAARNHSRVTVAMWTEQFHKKAKSPVYGYFYDHAPPPKVGGGDPDARRGGRPPHPAQATTPVAVNSEQAATDGVEKPRLLRIYETDVPRSTYTYSKAAHGARFGSYHGAEIPYCFNNLYAQTDHEWTDVDYDVADQVSDYWVNFVKYGNPNGPTSNGQSGFPETDGTSIMHLAKVCGAMPLCESKEREDFCREFLMRQKAF
jgi:carboxylesterase 2